MEVPQPKDQIAALGGYRSQHMTSVPLVERPNALAIGCVDGRFASAFSWLVEKWARENIPGYRGAYEIQVPGACAPFNPACLRYSSEIHAYLSQQLRLLTEHVALEHAIVTAHFDCLAQGNLTDARRVAEILHQDYSILEVHIFAMTIEDGRTGIYRIEF